MCGLDWSLMRSSLASNTFDIGVGVCEREFRRRTGKSYRVRKNFLCARRGRTQLMRHIRSVAFVNQVLNIQPPTPPQKKFSRLISRPFFCYIIGTYFTRTLIHNWMLFLVFHNNSIPATDESMPYEQGIALSVGLRPVLLGASTPMSPEDRKRYSFYNVIFFFGQTPKTTYAQL